MCSMWLEGKCQDLSETHIIVTAQLIEVASDSHVWSGAFEMEIEYNTIRLQQKVAHAISLKVRRTIRSLA